ncbi:hypothetical protein G7199_000661 [Salmonella enterica]|nr:hypothetical protein [Salmonella enterica]EEJ3649053.1 hypothetical protein [Salmonella enterica subsp. enterica]EGR6274836.1 hypothetical protein [Salmonella enterica]EHG0184802.1 hypothetical protein [Salmonella enterica]HAE4722225.1 hypothetical protein [Salmonella enterica subsp. salamae serovar 47:a:1,5]
MLTAENDINKDFRPPKHAIYADQDALSKLIIKLDVIEEEPAKKLALVVKKAFTELHS